ncbi:Uncharacterised protein [Proteus mirabilis]|nr:Uncharacterised protein [Proteus mirabilis]
MNTKSKRKIKVGLIVDEFLELQILALVDMVI